MFHRTILIAILTLSVACGGTPESQPNGTDGASSSSSSSSGSPDVQSPDGQDAQDADPTTDAGSQPAADAGSDADSTGDADSGPQAFSADCAGSVTQGGTAAWTYTVDDTGGTSQVHATIQVDAPGAPLCTGDASFTAPAAFSDWVTVSCGAGSWTLGLDRSTSKVDIRYNSPQGTQASWLPNCR